MKELMSGNIGVDSQPGRGSTFWFEISLRHSSKAPLHVQEGYDFTKLKILVVDDNETNRTIYKKLLTAWGASPEVCDLGIDAVDIA